MKTTICALILATTTLLATIPMTPARRSAMAVKAAKGHENLQGVYLLNTVGEQVGAGGKRFLTVSLFRDCGDDGFLFEDEVENLPTLRSVESFAVIVYPVFGVKTRQVMAYEIIILGCA